MAELDIEKLKSCTAIKQIPILTLDERWYHLITDKLKTDEICYWEKQVNELLKKQGQVNNDIKKEKKINNINKKKKKTNKKKKKYNRKIKKY